MTSATTGKVSSASDHAVLSGKNTAGAVSEFKRYFGERGWDMRCVEIPEHNYIRFEDDATEAVWMGFRTAWELKK